MDFILILVTKYREIGAWTFIALIEGLEALALSAFTNLLGWKIEEVQALIVNVRKELRDKSIHCPYY